MKQCTQLKARTDFVFKPASKGARKVSVRQGATFWVTSTEIAQRESGFICLARVTQPLHYDYPFSPDQIDKLFERAD